MNRNRYTQYYDEIVELSDEIYKQTQSTDKETAELKISNETINMDNAKPFRVLICDIIEVIGMTDEDEVYVRRLLCGYIPFAAKEVENEPLGKVITSAILVIRTYIEQILGKVETLHGRAKWRQRRLLDKHYEIYDKIRFRMELVIRISLHYCYLYDKYISQATDKPMRMSNADSSFLINLLNLIKFWNNSYNIDDAERIKKYKKYMKVIENNMYHNVQNNAINCNSTKELRESYQYQELKQMVQEDKISEHMKQEFKALDYVLDKMVDREHSTDKNKTTNIIHLDKRDVKQIYHWFDEHTATLHGKHIITALRGKKTVRFADE